MTKSRKPRAWGSKKAAAPGWTAPHLPWPDRPQGLRGDRRPLWADPGPGGGCTWSPNPNHHRVSAPRGPSHVAGALD